MRVLRRLLIVEDDIHLREAIAAAGRSWGMEITEAGSVADARAALSCAPDLLLLDVRLPDGSGLECAQAARALTPAPLVIAISGAATPEESFALAQVGVRAFVSKPVTLEGLRQAFLRALETPDDLGVHAVAQVGKVPVQTVTQAVRKAMVRQALALTKGNRTETAALLGVTRQAVQQMIRDLDIEAGADR
jgi:two-component system, response regulator RegA